MQYEVDKPQLVRTFAAASNFQKGILETGRL